MRTTNAMQLKARINNKAREAGIPPQALMQSYLIERFLVRLSESSWRTNVVIKGGILISSLVGIASRTTPPRQDLITSRQWYSSRERASAGAEKCYPPKVSTSRKREYLKGFDQD